MARSGLLHRGKRWLYLVHRWIGIVTCLLFLVWFTSGLVMVYVPFPKLSEQEKLAGLPPIDWGKVRIGPAGAQRIGNPDAPPETLSLEMMGDLPVWRSVSADGAPITLSAQTGLPLAAVDATQAGRIASIFARKGIVSVERLDRDQWTVAGGYDAQRPLYRARLEGEGGHDLYVSSRAGAVVLDTSSSERFWNWLGSVPHWIYPTVLRQNQPVWRQVVLWVSGPCILAAVTGMWIGLLRTRLGRRRFKGGRMTPHHGWMLWHHVAGLAGGTTLTLWIFSGWLSVDPGRLFDSPGIDPVARAAYIGARPIGQVDLVRLAQASGAGANRLTWRSAASRLWITADAPEGKTLLDAATLKPEHAERGAVVAAAKLLFPGARITTVQRLTRPDLYWYDIGTMPRLPVLRITFDDPAATWVHIDPYNGALLGTIDERGRIYRWVFDLFHKWDLNILTLNRPVWDVLLWIFSLLGIVTSVSGIRIGWRRLRA